MWLSGTSTQCRDHHSTQAVNFKISGICTLANRREIEPGLRSFLRPRHESPRASETVTAAVAHGLLTVTGTVTSTRSLRYAGNRLDPSHASLDPAT